MGPGNEPNFTGNEARMGRIVSESRSRSPVNFGPEPMHRHSGAIDAAFNASISTGSKGKVTGRTNMSDLNDSPISSPDKDLFGYNPLAQTIAKCILNVREPVGCVVAVHGRWGSGKSSLVNLVIHHLEATEATGLTVLQFQCWLYRSEDALAVGFFRELHAGLNSVLPGHEKAKTALQKIGARVAGSGPLLGAAVGIVGGSIGEQVTTQGFQVIENLIKTDESDEALQRRIIEALEKSNRRLLIVIDDIDRLTPEEALVIFRLIKSVGRLPNVIYLLAYDRIVIEKVVEERYPSEGVHYLEKIVQVGFDLLEPNQSKLIEMFKSQIKEIVGDEDISDQYHFGNMFYEVVAPELQTPRDVLRLSNALSVTYEAVRGEVDAADFLAIETLRLFRPNLYRTIRSNKSILVGFLVRDPYHGNQDKLAEHLEEQFLGKESQDDRSRLKGGLERMFPRLQSIWSNTHFGSDSAWSMARRVCSEVHFDTYFRFSLSSYTVPLSEVQKLIRRADKPEFVKSVFQVTLDVPLAEGRTKASFLLEELTYHANDMKFPKVKPFLCVLYSIADTLRVDADEIHDFMSVSNQDRLLCLTNALLLNRTSLEERSQILSGAIQGASLGWLVYISHIVSKDYCPPQKGKAPSREECLMTKDDADRTSDVALQQLQVAASDGSILKVRDLAFVLFRWRDLAGESSREVLEFCNSALEDEQSIVKFARAFLGQSWSGQVGDHVNLRHDRAQIKGIDELMDANRFRERLKEVLKSSRLDPEDKSIAQRLLKAWNSKSNGED